MGFDRDWFFDTFIKLRYRPAKAFKIFLSDSKVGSEEHDSLVKAFASYRELTRMDPLSVFIPNGKQYLFLKRINMALTSGNVDNPINLFQGANGSGKTRVGVTTILGICLGYKYSGNKLYDMQGLNLWRFPKVAWYCSTPEAIKHTIIPEFEKYLRPYIKSGRVVVSKEGSAMIQKIEFLDTGWKLYLKTYEQQKDSYESANVGVVAIDEPPPYAIWRAILSRDRKGMLVLCLMTPLGGAPFIFSEIERDKKTNGGIPTRCSVTYASLYDASETEGERGHLKDKYIKAKVEQLKDSPEEFNARILGKSTLMEGRILPFDPGVHIMEFNDMPIKKDRDMDMIICMSVDPHSALKQAVVFFAFFPKSHKKYVFAELPLDISTRFHFQRKPASWLLDDDIRQFKQIKETYFPWLSVTHINIIDRHFSGQTTNTKRSVAAEYEEIGRKLGYPIRFTKSYNKKDHPTSNELEFGHEILKRELRVGADGEPNIYIAPNCTHTIYSLLNYRTKVSTSASGEIVSEIVEDEKHHIDALRYGIVEVETRNHLINNNKDKKNVDNQKRLCTFRGVGTRRNNASSNFKGFRRG